MKTIVAKRTLLTPVTVIALVMTSYLPFNALAQRSVEEEVATSSSPTVVIELDSGSLEITGWDQDTVRVEGELDERVEEFEIELLTDDSVEITVEDERSRGWDGGRQSTRLKVSVPRRSTVSVETMNGAVEVSDLEGDLSVESVNGGVEVTNLSGRLSVETINGAVEASDINGDVEIEVVNGSIDLSQSTGDSLDIESVNGKIDIESSASDVQVSSVNGRTNVSLGQVRRFRASGVGGDISSKMQLMDHGDVKIETVSGEVEITLIEPLNISVSVDTMTGDVDNAISDSEAIEKSFGMGKTLDFTEGNASSEIRIDTLSGDIELKRE